MIVTSAVLNEKRTITTPPTSSLKNTVSLHVWYSSCCRDLNHSKSRFTWKSQIWVPPPPVTVARGHAEISATPPPPPPQPFSCWLGGKVKFICDLFYYCGLLLWSLTQVQIHTRTNTWRTHKDTQRTNKTELCVCVCVSVCVPLHSLFKLYYSGWLRRFVVICVQNEIPDTSESVWGISGRKLKVWTQHKM